MFEGAFLDSANGQDFSETPGYRKLVEQVSQIDPEEFSRRTVERLDYEAAVRDPRAHQGRYFRIRALVGNVEAVRLRTPIFDHEDVYRIVIAETDYTEEGYTEGVVLDMLPSPSELQRLHELELERDVVDVEGVFYRTVRFENLNGKMVEPPYFIARNVVRVDVNSQRKSSRLDLVAAVVAGAAVLYAVGRGVLVWQRHRSARIQDRGPTRRASKLK